MNSLLALGGVGEGMAASLEGRAILIDGWILSLSMCALSCWEEGWDALQAAR